MNLVVEGASRESHAKHDVSLTQASCGIGLGATQICTRPIVSPHWDLLRRYTKSRAWWEKGYLRSKPVDHQANMRIF